MAEEFVREKPDATREELAGYLGKPEELARELLETLEPEALERYRKRKKFLSRGCVAVLAAALICVSAWFVYFWSITLDVEVTETTIIYREFTEGT